MKKAEKEPPEIKADLAKSGRMSTPLTPKELCEMYVMVKEIYHHLGLDGHKIVSMKSIQEEARKTVLKWQERQDKKQEAHDKKK